MTPMGTPSRKSGVVSIVRVLAPVLRRGPPSRDIPSRAGLEVFDVNRRRSQTGRPATPDDSRRWSRRLLCSWALAHGSRRAEDLRPPGEDRGGGRPADTGGILGHDVHDGLEIGRRAGNDPQDLGGGGLLLERLGQRAVARLQLLEQAHILDGDDRLIGKVVTSSICFAVKGWTSVRRMTNAPMRAPSLRSGIPRVVRGCLRHSSRRERILRIGLDIVDVHHPPLERHPDQVVLPRSTPTGRRRETPRTPEGDGRCPQHGTGRPATARRLPRSRRRAASPTRGASPGRARGRKLLSAYDLEHLGVGRLLLERLGEIAVALLELLEQPDVLDGDDRLVGEGLKECDLLVREGLDGLATTTMVPRGMPSRRRGVTRFVPRVSARLAGYATRFSGTPPRRPSRPRRRSSSVVHSASGERATADRDRLADGYRFGDRAVRRREQEDVPIDAEISASLAPHTRAAFSATASSTTWRSVGDLLITRRIWLVAVC